MTIQREIRAVCDRCGIKADMVLSYATTPPEGWMEAKVVTRDWLYVEGPSLITFKGTPSETKHRWHLCPECAKGVQAYVRGKKGESGEGE